MTSGKSKILLNDKRTILQYSKRVNPLTANDELSRHENGFAEKIEEIKTIIRKQFHINWFPMK